MNTKLLRVVFVSPNDLKHESVLMKTIIDEINETGVGYAFNLEMKLWRWDTDSYPGFHAKGPQGLIDDLMNVEAADVVIGAFWRHLGKSGANSNSGTEHEIRKAYEGWKTNKHPRVMLYFRKGGSGPASDEERIQWERLSAFKKDIGNPALYCDYKDPDDFERKVRGHLSRYLVDRFKDDSTGGGELQLPLVPKVENWRPRLRQLFSGEVDICDGLKYREPLLEVSGDAFEASENLAEKVRVVASGLLVNHTQLVLQGEQEDWKLSKILDIDWGHDPVVLPSQRVKYSVVKSMRNEGYRVPSLSANAVLVRASTRELILQSRNPKMHTYGKHSPVHTVGGAYQDEGYGGDKCDLRNTLLRELHEELGVWVGLEGDLPMLFLRELTTGFIQLVYLGFSLSQRSKIVYSTDEGYNLFVGFDSLEQELRKKNWVPTGKAAVLAWLAFGAPNGSRSGEPASFDGKSAQDLFNAIVP